MRFIIVALALMAMFSTASGQPLPAAPASTSTQTSCAVNNGGCNLQHQVCKTDPTTNNAQCSCDYGFLFQTSACNVCPARPNVDKSVFFKMKTYGKWLSTEHKMRLILTIPGTVTVKSIVWNGATTQNLAYNNTNHGKWSMSKSETNECETKYGLTVPQTEFFGSGSDFKIKGSQLSSYLRINSKEDLEKEYNGYTYKYTRTISSALPLYVNLKTSKTITGRFKIKRKGLPSQRINPFVFFIGADDRFISDGEIEVTMEVHSEKCIDHSPADKGVRIDDPLSMDYIKIGTTPTFVWKVDANGDIEQIFDDSGTTAMCVEQVTWTFEPRRYTDNAWDILIQFDEGSQKQFEVEALIDIKDADVLDDIGFDSQIDLYKTQECNGQTFTKFALGEKFWAKIVLSNLIVETKTIECTGFRIVQTKNGQSTTTDLKGNAEYNFNQHTVTDQNNTHICGAELESAHFFVSIDGYDTVLEIEVEITYQQGQATIRRRRLWLPVYESVRYTLHNKNLNNEQSYYAQFLLENEERVFYGKQFVNTQGEFSIGIEEYTEDEDEEFRQQERKPDTDELSIPIQILGKSEVMMATSFNIINSVIDHWFEIAVLFIIFIAFYANSVPHVLTKSNADAEKTLCIEGTSYYGHDTVTKLLDSATEVSQEDEFLVKEIFDEDEHKPFNLTDAVI